MYLLLADHWFAQKESNVKSPESIYFPDTQKSRMSTNYNYNPN